MTSKIASLAEIIRAALECLRLRQPVFYDERDFQFEFAKALGSVGIHRVRVEFPIPTEKGCIDLVIGGETAIELKYIPVRFSTVWRDEEFQSNRIDNRSHVVGVEKDRARLQRLIADARSGIRRGFVIVVTNSNLLQKQPYGWRLWHKFSERKSGRFRYALLDARKPVGG